MLKRNLYLLTFLAALLVLSPPGHSTTLTIKNEAGEPLAQVMVTRTLVAKAVANLSDDGYAPDGVSNFADTTLTRFTDDRGNVSFDDTSNAVQYRARAQGYVDQIISA